MSRRLTQAVKPFILVLSDMLEQLIVKEEVCCYIIFSMESEKIKDNHYCKKGNQMSDINNGY